MNFSSPFRLSGSTRLLAVITLAIPFWMSQGTEDPVRGTLLYQRNFSAPEDVAGWIMEGNGITEFRDGWMEMYSPVEETHHVFWCPEDFPDRFIAEWEAQNLEPDAGLCIIFFAAKGADGKDIFDPSLPIRDGVFIGYTKGAINSYHISYYTNTPDKPDRGKAHLRKNNEFNLVQEGEDGIPADSDRIHQLKLIKDGPHIRFFVDGRKVIDWTDTQENEPRPHYEAGKVGFRQMKWTRFRYRNLRVWSIADPIERLDSMKDVVAIHPKERIWPEPAFGMVASRNSPTLLWPPVDGNSVSYEVRLSQHPDFASGKADIARNIPWAMYNPFRELAQGSWYWQWRTTGGRWSDTHHFLITSESDPWNPPSAEKLVASVPAHRPRVLVDGPSLKTFREINRDRVEAESIITQADSVFEQAIPSEKNDIVNIRGDDPDKTEKLQKDASKVIGETLYQGVAPLCKAFVLTGEQKYADKAIAWAMEGAQWDPDGVTRINDFGDARIMLSMALVYDTLHDQLNTQQKRALLDATAARANNFYQDYVNNKESVVLSNHVWQHIFHYFFDTAIALRGDHPDADHWLSYLYNMFLARAPILGGEDGGWVHGVSYFRMNMEMLIDVPQRIKSFTGFDFIAHTPWYWENTYYFLYGFPPGSFASGFSDNSHELPEPRGDYLAYADALSRLVRNPHAAWYRDRITEIAGDLAPYYEDYYKENLPKDLYSEVRVENATMLQWYRMKYLDGMIPAIPESPANLPKARVFKGVGLVTMHSRDLSQPAGENLFVAMRASPYGTYSHMLADNNTFNMVYGGDRLFYHTGYKVAMSAPHRQLYYKHTKSHNGILLDGEGQPYETQAYAWIENFLTGHHLSYAVGNASNAYDSPTENFDAGLKTFRRHIAMLRPDIVVIYDELEARKPVEWSYLLHSYNQIQIEKNKSVLSTTNRAGRAMVHLYASDDTKWSVTDEYPVPAQNWRGITDAEGEIVNYTNNAWHFSADSAKTRKMRFLAIFQVYPKDETEDYHFNEIRKLNQNTYRLGKWRITAVLNPELPARITITNTTDGLAFTSAGDIETENGIRFGGNDPRSAKLAEYMDGRWVLHESGPEYPQSAEAAIRFQEMKK